MDAHIELTLNRLIEKSDYQSLRDLKKHLDDQTNYETLRYVIERSIHQFKEAALSVALNHSLIIGNTIQPHFFDASSIVNENFEEDGEDIQWQLSGDSVWNTLIQAAEMTRDPLIFERADFLACAKRIEKHPGFHLNYSQHIEEGIVLEGDSNFDSMLSTVGWKPIHDAIRSNSKSFLNLMVDTWGLPLNGGTHKDDDNIEDDYNSVKVALNQGHGDMTAHLLTKGAATADHEVDYFEEIFTPQTMVNFFHDNTNSQADILKAFHIAAYLDGCNALTGHDFTDYEQNPLRHFFSPHLWMMKRALNVEVLGQNYLSSLQLSSDQGNAKASESHQNNIRSIDKAHMPHKATQKTPTKRNSLFKLFFGKSKSPEVTSEVPGPIPVAGPDTVSPTDRITADTAIAEMNRLLEDFGNLHFSEETALQASSTPGVTNVLNPASSPKPLPPTKDQMAAFLIQGQTNDYQAALGLFTLEEQWNLVLDTWAYSLFSYWHMDPLSRISDSSKNAKAWPCFMAALSGLTQPQASSDPLDKASKDPSSPLDLPLGPEGLSLLSLSCVLGQSEVTSILLHSGASLNHSVTHVAKSPMALACQFGYFQLAKNLLKAGSDPWDGFSSEGFLPHRSWPLHEALKQPDLSLAKQILSVDPSTLYQPNAMSDTALDILHTLGQGQEPWVEQCLKNHEAQELSKSLRASPVNEVAMASQTHLSSPQQTLNHPAQTFLSTPLDRADSSRASDSVSSAGSGGVGESVGRGYQETLESGQASAHRRRLLSSLPVDSVSASSHQHHQPQQHQTTPSQTGLAGLAENLSHTSSNESHQIPSRKNTLKPF